MIDRLKLWCKGVAIAAASMAVFAIALGCFIALMLLVISMEEGGDNLSAYSLSLTAAMILLAQGSGFSVAPVSLTLTPLLLTLLLIALIRAFAQRLTCSISGYIGGLMAWLTLDMLFSRGTNVALHDAIWQLMAKGAGVFTLGYLLAAIPVSLTVVRALERIRQSVSEPLRRTIRIGVMTSITLISLYIVCGFVTVIVWSVRNRMAVVALYELLGMSTGSRIVTTIACLAWLPNVCIWAVSWLFGGGFAIGDLGSFTLWVGQSSQLPTIPVFGILPEPISDQRLRIALVSIPLACGLLCGMISMIANRGFSVRAAAPDDTPGMKRMIVAFAYPAGSFCISSALMSVLCSLMFLIANGGLGNQRLAHLGVDVMHSTQALARPTAFGLMSAWIIALIGVALVFGIRWAARRIRMRHESHDTDVSNSGQTLQTVTTKEEQDDKHESTDTTSVGVRIP